MFIDLNSDLGENSPGRIVSDDEAMLSIVTSANVACGFHAGYAQGIKDTLMKAAKANVTVGAHPGYKDFEGFGRRPLDIPSKQLQADVEYQLAALSGLATLAGTQLSYVKPHGALYNQLAQDEKIAGVVACAIKAINPNLVFLGLAGTLGLNVAEKTGLTVAAEAFADRAYMSDGSLVPRSQEGAVLHDPQLVGQRMLDLVNTGKLTAIDGSTVNINADSICVHGDSAGAIDMARSVRAKLEHVGVTIRPFAKKA